MIFGWVGEDWVYEYVLLGIVWLINVCMGECEWIFEVLMFEMCWYSGIVNVWM